MEKLFLACRALLLASVVLTALVVVAACGSGGAGPEADPVPDPEPGDDGGSLEDAELIVYSGRSKTLVDPILRSFSDDTGIKVGVKYASSSELVATILEEGLNSPADVVFLQDTGALGALAQAGMLGRLPDELMTRVDSRFRSPSGVWVGTSGRARTVVYNTESINPDQDLPASIMGFTDSKWQGRLGWAPTNGSFQAFVTALRIQLGDDQARAWLKGIEANDPNVYANNTSIVVAAASGEIAVGFVNHYYLHRFLAEEGESFGARNQYYVGGDPGALVNVAGVGILNTTDDLPAAERFVDYMLEQKAQVYFSEETFEFPLLPGVDSPAGAPSLESLDPPDIDLGALEDLRGTLALLQELGILG